MNPLRVNWTILTDGSVDENKNDKLCYVNQSIYEISALRLKEGTPESVIKKCPCGKRISYYGQGYKRKKRYAI